MSHNVTIFANFDTTALKDAESSYYNIPRSLISTINNVPANITLRITDQKLQTVKLAVTSNGITGTGFVDNTFNLNYIFYKNQRIHFNISCVSENNFRVKNIPALVYKDTFINGLAENEVTVRIYDENDIHQIYKIIPTTSSDVGGYFEGYFVPTNLHSKLYLKVFANIQGVGIVEGQSTPFDVLPESGRYHFQKRGEDYSQKDAYLDLLYQPNLQENPNFFDKFVGPIVGDGTDPNSIGTRIFEKIHNFVSNNADVDFSNIKSVISQFKSIGEDVKIFAEAYPNTLARIIDFYSVNISKLKQQFNLFQFDFVDKQNTTVDKHSINIGAEISKDKIFNCSGPFTPIVAYEKFSEKFIFLNTTPTNLKFSLDDYRNNWGWCLVPVKRVVDNNILVKNNSIQVTYNPYNIFDYYSFYEWKPSLPVKLSSSFTSTHIPDIVSSNDFTSKRGVVNEIVLNNLTNNTNLIKI